MKYSKFSPSPFEMPNIKNAKVIKTEIKSFQHNIVYNYTKPLSFETSRYSLETIPLIREHLDTYLFYIRHRSTKVSTEYSSFQITFPRQETSSTQTYRRTINPINLQVHIKDVFYAFSNQVKEFNLALENPKFSPNALQELEHNFEVDDIERIVITQDNPHHGLDHSYTPEEYIQQVEARLTFAIGEEPQNTPVKYRSWRNRRMAYI